MFCHLTRIIYATIDSHIFPSLRCRFCLFPLFPNIPSSGRYLYEGYSLATWEQQGILAYAWLETVEAGQWPLGIFEDIAYVLDCTSSRVAKQGTMSSRQKALGLEMTDLLRSHLVDVLLANGWSTPYKTKAGRDIWVWYAEGHPRRTTQAPEPATKARELVLSEHDLLDIIVAGFGAEVPGEAQADQDQVLELLLAEPEKPRSHVVNVIGGSEAKERGQEPAYSREVFTREVTFTCIVCGDTVTQQRYPGHMPLYCSEGCREARVAEKTRERVAKHRERKKAAIGNMRSQEDVTNV